MVQLATPVFITVRAVTNKVGDDIRRGLKGEESSVRRSGESLGQAFSRGFSRGIDVNTFKRVENGLRTMEPAAESARKAFANLVRGGYTLQAGLSLLVGGISAAISSIGALAGAAGGAVTTFSVLGNAIFAMGTAFAAVRLATNGVGSALQKLQQSRVKAAKLSATQAKQANKDAAQAIQDAQAQAAATRRIEDAERSLQRVIADNRDRMLAANQDVIDSQNELNKAVIDGREELQQIGFDAEDAALNEKKAALELEKAREALARAQDLPPNSRVRREAELAYAEADLNYRKAKDANSDLQKEQDRLAKTGVNGLDSVVAARNKLAQAEANRSKEAQDALQSEEDAQRNLNDAKQAAVDLSVKQDAADSASGASDGTSPALAAWDAGLNKYQRAFVLFLDSLRPKFQELELIASRAFLPKLQIAIQNLMNLAFPVVARGIGLVAGAMGDAAINFSNVITETQNLAKLNTLFESSARLIGIFGDSLGNVYDILTSLLVITAPMAERFFGWLNAQLGSFADWLNTPVGTNSVTQFFALAEQTAVKFGDVFGNIFQGIGAVIQANMGPGSGGWIILDYMKQATDSFGKSDNLKQFFADVATNATHVFDALGAIVGVLGSLGANQNIGKAFDVLTKPENVAAFENIVQIGANAGPSLAGLVGTITQIVSAMSDTGALQIFFDTLKGIFDVVLAFVSDPNNKAFLDFWGRIHAVFLAVGFVITPLLLGFKIYTGIIIGLLKPLGFLVGLFSAKNAAMVKDLWLTARIVALYAVDYAKAMGGMLVQMGQWIALKAKEFTATVLSVGAMVAQKGAMIAMAAASKIATAAQWLFNAALDANPIGLIIVAIGALVAGLIWFFTQTKLGQEIWANFTQFLTDAWNNTVKFIGDALTNLGNFFRDAWNFIVTAVSVAVQFLVDLFLNWTIYGLIIKNWNNIVKFFGDVWVGIIKFFTDAFAWIVQLFLNWTIFGWIIKNWDGITKYFQTFWKAVQDGFDLLVKGITATWEGIKKAVAMPINFVIDTVYNNGLRSFWNDIADALNMKSLKLPKADTVKFASGGVMPGYSPGRDIHRFYSPTGGYLHLSGGEAIMRPEWTRMVGGPRAVERMNRAARSGRAFASGGVYGSSVGRTQRFASGGVIDLAGDVLNGLAKVGQVLGDFFSNPSKAVQTHLIDGIIKPLTSGIGEGGFAQLIGGVPLTIADWIGKSITNMFGAGDQASKPANAMGWQAQWAIVKQAFPWATLNSSVRPGATTPGGGQSYHALGRAIDVTASMAIFDYLRTAFPNSRELIYSPAGGRQLQNGKNHLWGEPVKSMHYNHVHWAMAKGGTVFPSPGGSIVRVAEAGKPERVEPLDENGISERDKAIIDYLSNGGGGTTINVYQQPGENAEEFAHRVSRILSNDMRRGGL